MQDAENELNMYCLLGQRLWVMIYLWFNDLTDTADKFIVDHTMKIVSWNEIIYEMLYELFFACMNMYCHKNSWSLVVGYIILPIILLKRIYYIKDKHLID